MKKLYIFGAGGHGREVAWVAQRTLAPDTKIEFVVDDNEYCSSEIAGMPVRLLEGIEDDKQSSYIVALGNPYDRRRITELMDSRFSRLSMIDPSCIYSEHIEFGEGVVVMPGCILTSNISIASNTHINIGCRISHDVVVGEFSTLCPGVYLAGNVHVGEGVYMGINSTVINGKVGKPVSIGEGAVIAAGACVINDVPAYSVVAGVPAVVKSQR